MKKSSQTHEPKAKPVDPQRISEASEPERGQYSAQVRPEDIKDKMPNDLELAQLVVAHLPYVTGYKTLPAQANGALHNVLEVLATIRRWKKGFLWPSDSPDESKQIEARADVIMEVQRAFQSIAGDRLTLNLDEFLRAVLHSVNSNLSMELSRELWKEFCKIKKFREPEDGWGIQQAGAFGPEFREWFPVRKDAVAKRLQRARKKVAAQKGLATKNANEMKIGTAKVFSKEDTSHIDQAVAKHSSPTSSKGRQKFRNSI
jgi:hypothetical protein